MNIKTTLSEDGEKLYLIIGDPDTDPDATAVQFNVDEAKQFLKLIYDLIQEAQGTQDLIAMGFKNGQ